MSMSEAAVVSFHIARCNHKNPHTNHDTRPFVPLAARSTASRRDLIHKEEMPQLETSSYALAALTAGGGLMGFVKSGSVPSLIAGTAVGVLYGLGGYRIQNRQPYGVELSLLASIILGGSAFPRAIRLRKPVPVLLSVLSAYGLLTFGRAFQQKL
ncbi:hypothetical protein E4U17_000784 [Claviceps sp. LM77 group G4]|nr:hypothetical protein E4U17_000784 [Claviceps sp. LM77 group G4]KAG6070435.1 hypothetical protein E4U16_006937 [Claviceps sp. LM84 group G4]KAG6076692.1 hypothetical protein E4U33_001699 [Claviceps sp. LM78 group G4]